MDGLAEDAVGLATDGALELVHFVLVDAPPSAVGGLAVEAVGKSTLTLGHKAFVVGLELFFCNTLHMSKCIRLKYGLKPHTVLYKVARIFKTWGGGEGLY